jgi:predicted RNase H-like nuclease
VLEPGLSPTAHHLTTIDEIDEVSPDAEVVGIDMPMAFPTTGVRAAELSARTFLAARRSSVFPTPPRAVLETTPYAAANALAFELTGRGMSRQSYALAAKIFEVEAWRLSREAAGRTGRVVEVHPELTFATMLGRPATHSKKSWAGMVERRSALAEVGVVLEGSLGIAGARAAVDDVLDAAAAAWTARRVADGTATCHPPPPTDDVAIWA